MPPIPPLSLRGVADGEDIEALKKRIKELEQETKTLAERNEALDVMLEHRALKVGYLTCVMLLPLDDVTNDITKVKQNVHWSLTRNHKI